LAIARFLAGKNVWLIAGDRQRTAFNIRAESEITPNFLWGIFWRQSQDISEILLHAGENKSVPFLRAYMLTESHFLLAVHAVNISAEL
jgi:hypothetical protein